MSHADGAAFTLDDEVAALALEAATLLSTLKAGTTAEEFDAHARAIDAAMPRIEAPLAQKWMAATAQSLRHAAVFAAARRDLDPAAVAVMDARMSVIARSQVAIVAAMTVARGR